MFLPSGLTAVPAALPAVKLAHGTCIFVHVVVSGTRNVGCTHVVAVPAQVPMGSPAFAGVDGSVSCICRVRVAVPLGLAPRTQNVTPLKPVALRHPLSQVPRPPP